MAGGAAKKVAGKVGKEVGKLIKQGVRKAGQAGGSAKPKKIGDTFVVKGGRRVKVTTKTSPSADYNRKSFMQSQKDKYKAQTGKDYPTTQKKPKQNYTGGGDEGSGIYASDSGRTSLGAKYGDEPIKVSGPDQGKPKIGKVTTYKQDPKTKKFTKSKPKTDKDAEMYGQGYDPLGFNDHYDWRSTLDEKCWKGYEKKGMKTMFGKRYPNCVKKSKKKK